MPNFVFSPNPISVDRSVTAQDSVAAAKKAGQMIAKDMEGDGVRTFSVYLLRVPDPVERFEVTVTASVSRDVAVAPYVAPPSSGS